MWFGKKGLSLLCKINIDYYEAQTLFYSFLFNWDCFFC